MEGVDKAEDWKKYRAANGLVAGLDEKIGMDEPGNITGLTWKYDKKSLRAPVVYIFAQFDPKEPRRLMSVIRVDDAAIIQAGPIGKIVRAQELPIPGVTTDMS